MNSTPRSEIRPVLKYPGAKWRIADWIIAKMPPHHSYVEPFFGSGAVFFRKQPSPIETINDIDKDVVNLFLQIRNNSDELMRLVASTPFSRAEYDDGFSEGNFNDVEKARRFLVQLWQGHGFRTRGGKVGWKNDVQGREASYAMRNWYRLPGWINDAIGRLREAQIECRPAIDVITRFNYPNVLIYADPPYVLTTRTGLNYKYEMNDQDHVLLCESLLAHNGQVMLSGYDNELYNSMLSGWEKHSIRTTAEHGLPRTETLWCNFKTEPYSLFSTEGKCGYE